VPDPVHEHARQRGMLKPEGAHADDRYPKTGDDKNDQNVGEKEAWNGDEEIGDESGRAVIESSSENGGPDPDRKREGPGDDGSQEEEPEAVLKALPYLEEDRLVVFPRDGLARKKIPVKKVILDVKRLVEVECLAETLDHLYGKLRIERVHLTRFSRGQVDDQEGDHRDKEESDDLLYNATAYEGKHEKSPNA
jgi:hypothetical protein